MDSNGATERLPKRRQVVEPMTGHMKADGLPRRNWLKGALGDALHAVLCGVDHNLRIILAHLRLLLHAVIDWHGWALEAGIPTQPANVEM